MPNKTQGIYDLASEIVQQFEAPYPENITKAVFTIIKESPNLKSRYNQLVDELSKAVVNQWIGRYTKRITGLNNMSKVKTPGGELIESYTKLH